MNAQEQVPYSLLRSEVYDSEEDDDDPISQRDTDPAPPPEASPESDGKPSVQVNVTHDRDDGLD